MNDNITPKQQLILNSIINLTKLRGYPPSVREICETVGLKSTSTVHGYLERLQKRGYIQKDCLIKRGITVVKKDIEIENNSIINIPIIGKVAAGTPVFAYENIEGTFPISSSYANKGNLFVLKVIGDSMINVGIYNNDNIIICQQSSAENGDIVVALIEDEATIKTFYKENGCFRLQPENDNFKPLILKEVTILGKAVALFRNF